MNKYFMRNVRVTSVFFLFRFVVALAISVLYIFVAAAIQYYVVKLLGESTFNYIVGGLLSLFLGVIVCNFVGTIVFMFIKGWHVAALAYVPKIIKTGAPAFAVGMRAFAKNLVSFGAVYGVRALLKNTVANFKDKLWDIADDIPYVDLLRRFAEHPIVEHLAFDILHYGFDAAIYYLVRFPAKEVDELPETLFTAIKKYLYCIPAILISSVQTYICFRFIPKLIKWVLILWVLLSQGPVAGILITVLMLPIFYILDNALFDPLTMIVFISVYAKRCDKPIDENDPVVQVVNSIIDGTEDIGTTSEDFEDVEEEQPKPKKKSGKTAQQSPPPDTGLPPEPTDEELFGEVAEPPVSAGLSSSALGSLADLAAHMDSGDVSRRPMDADIESLPLQDEEEAEGAPPTVPDFTQEQQAPIGLAELFRSVNGGDLDADPLAGLYGSDDGPEDRAQSMLAGEDD